MVKRGAPVGVWAFVGEWLLVREARDACIAQTLAQHGLSADAVQHFDARQHSAGAVLASANTLSLFEPHQVVVVRAVDAWNAAEQERLVAYLAAPAPSATLILDAVKLDGRGKLVKALKTHQALELLEAPKGAMLKRWIDQRAESRGLKLRPDVSTFLLHTLGQELAELDDALERLRLCYGAGAKVDRTMVAPLLPESAAGETVWLLVDALARQDKPGLLRAGGALLASREAPLKLLAMLLRQVAQLQTLKHALASGESPQDAARSAGIPPFKVSEQVQAAGRVTPRQLAHWITVLADMDQALKRSKRPDYLVFEAGLLALSA